ncbi:MAG TPA: thioredoxin domain-containing protein [Pyrinomonadaceae bacterium]|nr:thioredoxin domain-containing protein [Pyrinomonadaceae bacterium]
MRKEVKILALISVVVAVAVVFGARYYRDAVQGERKGGANADGPLVRPDSPALGPADAPVTLVEFLDPECESCGAFHPTVKRILKEYDGKVRLVVRYMPFHPNSVLAATVTEAAGEQGKYWEMQELLFRRQPEWGEVHGHGGPAAPPVRRAPPAVLFERYAAELGLDVERVRAAVAENRYAAKVERDRRDGAGLGVTKTPTFFVNGRQLARFSQQDLRALIDEELKN